MGRFLTILVLAAFCLVIGFKVWRANRRAAADRKRAERERMVREERERELRTRLERVKKKRDELESAKDAIQSDPARAARVVARMMKDKES